MAIKKKEISEIFKNCLTNQGIILISADLTHFGESYKFQGLESPEVYSKYQYEENLIFNLINSNYLDVRDELTKNPDLSCSKTNLNFLSYLTQSEKMEGRVVDYYDSHCYTEKGYRKYLIPLNSVKMLVSYVGIVFF